MTIMKFALPAFCALTLTAGVAQAEGLDANGDGHVIFDEILMVMPDMNEEQFAAIDVNGDGMLDEAEVAAAIEAGVLPAK
ncbi:MAG: hypothetical protein ACRBCL_16085 [Maritimibacter sp.]